MQAAIDLESLIGGTFEVDQAQDAFDAVAAASLPGVAALIQYDTEGLDRSRTIEVRPHKKPGGQVGISIVGCGNHVLGKHLPYLRSMKNVDIRGLGVGPPEKMHRWWPNRSKQLSLQRISTRS